MADEVATRVYRWEYEYVEPRQRPEQKLLSTEQCRQLIERACRISGTPVPALRFKKVDRVPCKADFRKWEISLAVWGHSAVTVLHEVAHLATFRQVLAGENGHGPSFVGAAMIFYNQFIGIDMNYLVETATRARVSFSAIRPVKIVGSASPFGGEEF